MSQKHPIISAIRQALENHRIRQREELAGINQQILACHTDRSQAIPESLLTKQENLSRSLGLDPDQALQTVR